jgi:hypothetical protein
MIHCNTLDNDRLIRAFWIEIDEHGNLCSLRIECPDKCDEKAMGKIKRPIMPVLSGLPM